MTQAGSAVLGRGVEFGWFWVVEMVGVHLESVGEARDGVAGSRFTSVRSGLWNGSVWRSGRLRRDLAALEVEVCMARPYGPRMRIQGTPGYVVAGSDPHRLGPESLRNPPQGDADRRPLERSSTIRRCSVLCADHPTGPGPAGAR